MSADSKKKFFSFSKSKRIANGVSNRLKKTSAPEGNYSTVHSGTNRPASTTPVKKMSAPVIESESRPASRIQKTSVPDAGSSRPTSGTNLKKSTLPRSSEYSLSAEQALWETCSPNSGTQVRILNTQEKNRLNQVERTLEKQKERQVRHIDKEMGILATMEYLKSQQGSGGGMQNKRHLSNSAPDLHSRITPRRDTPIPGTRPHSGHHRMLLQVSQGGGSGGNRN